MSDNKKLTELQQLRKDIAKDTQKAIKASEVKISEDTKKTIQASEERLTKKLSKKIDDSQKDTIDVLMDAIHTGYSLHDKRIKRLEKELDLSPLKQ